MFRTHTLPNLLNLSVSQTSEALFLFLSAIASSFSVASFSIARARRSASAASFASSSSLTLFRLSAKGLTSSSSDGGEGMDLLLVEEDAEGVVLVDAKGWEEEEVFAEEGRWWEGRGDGDREGGGDGGSVGERARYDESSW